MNQCDYDGRTALHVGAAEGHEDVVSFLVQKCQCDLYAKDRYVVSINFKRVERVSFILISSSIQVLFSFFQYVVV